MDNMVRVLDAELTREEHRLLNVAYRKVTGSLLAAWRVAYKEETLVAGSAIATIALATTVIYLRMTPQNLNLPDHSKLCSNHPGAKTPGLKLSNSSSY
nr:hypothetical protein Iba_scaffold8198CG0010 [Ipomoea batatas]GME19416.1 hypothetical protein Iba_scaffold22795CG0010 [Ipomoea batatas]